MAQTNVNIRIDETDKMLFDEICGQLGMTMSTAFNVPTRKRWRPLRT